MIAFSLPACTRPCVTLRRHDNQYTYRKKTCIFVKHVGLNRCYILRKWCLYFMVHPLYPYNPPLLCYVGAKKRVLTENLSAHLTLDSCLEWCYLWTSVKPRWYTHTFSCRHRGVAAGQKWVWAQLPWIFPAQNSTVIPRGFNRSKRLPFYHPAVLPDLDQWLFDSGIPIVTAIQYLEWLNKAGWGVQASLCGVDCVPVWQLCVCVCV